MENTSRLPGFHRLDPQERLRIIAAGGLLSEEDFAILSAGGGLSVGDADQMQNNVIGVYGIPLSVATNFRVNGRDLLVPMAVEEASVVAAASNGARLARAGGGFTATGDPPVMVAQIQVLDVPDPIRAVDAIEGSRPELLAFVDSTHPNLIARGGGSRDLETRVLIHPRAGTMLVIHLYVDVCDAMGANVLNTMAEALAPKLAGLTGGRVVLRILSNLADRRMAVASCLVPAEILDRDPLLGRVKARLVEDAQALADIDPYRAATHNKGIMNGIDAVAVATGNDWRAVEAGAHAFAGMTGHYRPLTRWCTDEHGNLRGSITIPLALGIVGGTTRIHPAARISLKLLGVLTARELNEIAACVGLAQNLAAVLALATDGIQAGHMPLHARQTAQTGVTSPRA